MSQKSSVPQAVSFVSVLLKRDTDEVVIAFQGRSWPMLLKKA
jgi:hypothetical protein